MPNPWWPGAAYGFGALATPAFNVALVAEMYRLTPDKLLGRVRGAGKLVAWACIPLGSLTGGFLTGAVGTATTLWTLSVAMLVITAVATAAPSMCTIGTASG
ncbi:hypothetical protein GCM10023322_09860 [Rugosimonospora acidiphila]|uniref:MFS transporter n=1 Tax=Rugosimonospora acidiphila TaxID=556531 RepID=A0ABP9RLP7_9ACTN